MGMVGGRFVCCCLVGGVAGIQGVTFWVSRRVGGWGKKKKKAGFSWYIQVEVKKVFVIGYKVTQGGHSSNNKEQVRGLRGILSLQSLSLPVCLSEQNTGAGCRWW